MYAELRPEGGTVLSLINLADGNEQELYSCEGPEQCSRAVLAPKVTACFEKTTPAAREAGEEQGSREVWVLDLDTTQAFRVSPQDHEASNPAWSLQNDLAYYNHTLQAAAVVDPRLGADEALLRLIPATVDSSLEWNLMVQRCYSRSCFLRKGVMYWWAWKISPVFHSHLTYHDIRGDLTIDLSGDRDGLVEDSNPVYDPSGEWIAFTRKYLEPERWTLGRQIWVMAADASERRILINDPDYQHASLVWSLIRPGLSTHGSINLTFLIQWKSGWWIWILATMNCWCGEVMHRSGSPDHSGSLSASAADNALATDWIPMGF